MDRHRIPHFWLVMLLSGLVAGGMLASGAASRWDDPLATLYGEFGIVTVLTGVVTVFFLGYRAVVGHLALVNTQRSLEHTQRAEVATRFQKGMEMLANDHEATRIGGLYLLRDVATALPNVYWMSVVDSLLPFIRSGCKSQMDMFNGFLNMLSRDEEPDESDAWLDTTPADVMVALRILGRGWPELRDATKRQDTESWHLRGLVLANVQLRGLILDRMSFDGAVFQGVSLTDCTFNGCSMNIRTSKTRFVDCDLRDVEIFTRFVPFGVSDLNLTKCDLRGAEIDGNRVSELSIEECNLDGAKIIHPDASYF
jgi:hypothetical protein